MPVSKKTIAQCVWNYYPFVADQICSLKRYQPVIFSTRGKDASTILEKYEVPLFTLEAERTPLRRVIDYFTWRTTRVPFSLLQALHQSRAQLLHAHFAPQGIGFLPMAKYTNLPLLTSFHGYDVASFPQQPGNRQRLKQLFNRGTLFTAVSVYMREQLAELGCPSDKIVIHRYGVNVDTFTYNPRICKAKRITILTVCNFAEKKGLPYLIRAFKQVKDNFPQSELRIVGGSFKGARLGEEVEMLIQEFALTDSVTLAGFCTRAHLVDEYHRAQIFVLPSVTAVDGDQEGVPVVLLEAQATGLPVISTYHAGIPEAVLDGESGFLVPEKDIDALAEKICLLLERPQDWSEMGRLGRRHIEREFNLQEQVEKLECIYGRLVG